MRVKSSGSYALRIIAEIVFLALFTILFFRGSIQLWLAVFAAGAALSLVFGRIYCGYICPMNTLFRPIGWIKKKLGIGALKTPGFMKRPAFRYVFIVLFFGSMMISKRAGNELPLPAILLGVSVLIVLFFEEALWHNALCPYGTIFSFTSRPAKKGMVIDEAACISCGKCQKVCPTNAIDTLESKKRSIRKVDCLVCQSCAEVCSVKAIRYK
jgi:polyferredoxin